MALPYHFNVIYNDAKSPLSSTPDTRLSFEFTELLVRKCNPHRWRSYYKDRDLLPGQNIFNELTKVIKGSEYVIIIFTEGFVSDCWSTYHKHTALNMLIKENRVDKLIPILVGVDTLPDDLGSFNPMSFSKNSALWESDESRKAWNKLILRLEGVDTINSADGDTNGRAQRVQESRDNTLRPELIYTREQGLNSTVENSKREQGDARRLVAQATATIELNNLMTSTSQQTSISLSESPVVRPPPSVTPSQPGARPVPNQNSFANVHSDHIAESTNTSTSRQLSLSKDQDLQLDFIPAGTPGTDSGYSTVEPLLSASNTSLCETTPESSEADDFINHKNDGETLTEANVADSEVTKHSTEWFETTDQPYPISTQGKDDTQGSADLLDTDSKNECQDTDEVSSNYLMAEKKPSFEEEPIKQESEKSQADEWLNRDRLAVGLSFAIPVILIVSWLVKRRLGL